MSDLNNIPLRDGGQRGGGGRSGHNPELAPPDLLPVDFSMTARVGDCGCDARDGPRQHVAITGFLLGAFLLLHLAINAFGFWLARFQTVAHLINGIGSVLPKLEMGLVLAPLIVHVVLGLRSLRREGLKLGVQKQHHGSDTRYWLQRVTAVILLVFLAFQVASMHQWGSQLVWRMTHWPALGRDSADGLFEPQRAFASVSVAVPLFRDGRAANPANLLIAEFYLLGIASAVYHLANGVATGAEVLGWVTSQAQKERFWRCCMGAGAVLTVIGMLAWYAIASGAWRSPDNWEAAQAALILRIHAHLRVTFSAGRTEVCW